MLVALGMLLTTVIIIYFHAPSSNDSIVMALVTAASTAVGGICGYSMNKGGAGKPQPRVTDSIVEAVTTSKQTLKAGE